ncbi:MAG: hypothetical protein V1874_17090 [Spirochaetota bacterium]
MKRIFFILSFLFLSNIIYAEEAVIPKIIYESAYPENPNRKDTLALRKYFKENFNNSGKEEYIAFYYPKEDTDHPFFTNIIIYVVKGNKVLNRYTIYDAAYFNYNELDLKTIKELEPIFGPWNGYYYSYDLNKSGTKEIIVFKYGGRVFNISIYEFKKDRFIPLLNIDYGWLRHITINPQDKSLSLYYGYEYEAHKKGLQKETYRWNEQKWVYELVKKEEGVDFKQ